MGAKSTKPTTARKLETGSKTGVLNLSARKLTVFPAKLLAGGGFARLRTLDLSKNKLKYLDGLDLSVLKNLKSLNLAGNLLRSAGRALSGLRALQTLDLSDNRLATLPALPAAGALKAVNVSGNALVLLDFPPDVPDADAKQHAKQHDNSSGTCSNTSNTSNTSTRYVSYCLHSCTTCHVLPPPFEDVLKENGKSLKIISHV